LLTLWGTTLYALLDECFQKRHEQTCFRPKRAKFTLSDAVVPTSDYWSVIPSEPFLVGGIPTPSEKYESQMG